MLLQVFQLSLQHSNDPIIWAASLFHDIGKSINGPKHDLIGAQMLEGILNPKIIWLIKHHLDLIKHSKKTLQKYKNPSRLNDLQLLRKLDIKDRDPFVEVMSVETAINTVIKHSYQTYHSNTLIK
ncbi:MAG: HD domain-containing protein [Saccharospirillaceae bacterium]|nr:HD domain-containing protein [Pseudomonadales bacterium]NRB80055.1 HD domain-containing protein [Saccharospirillaceae bacterium]